MGRLSAPTAAWALSLFSIPRKSGIVVCVALFIAIEVLGVVILVVVYVVVLEWPGFLPIKVAICRGEKSFAPTNGGSVYPLPYGAGVGDNPESFREQSATADTSRAGHQVYLPERDGPAPYLLHISLIGNVSPLSTPLRCRCG